MEIDGPEKELFYAFWIWANSYCFAKNSATQHSSTVLSLSTLEPIESGVCLAFFFSLEIGSGSKDVPVKPSVHSSPFYRGFSEDAERTCNDSRIVPQRIMSLCHSSFLLFDCRHNRIKTCVSLFSLVVGSHDTHRSRQGDQEHRCRRKSARAADCTGGPHRDVRFCCNTI